MTNFPLQSVAIAVASALLLGASGCTVDKDNPKYDERRYTEIQKARCGEIATVLSKPLLAEEPEDYDTSLQRCEALKSLTFEEYKKLADYARENGSWDIYLLFPEKKPLPATGESQ